MGKRVPIEQRLLSKILRDKSGCWIWVGSRNKSGYGNVKVTGRVRPAHRVSYETFVGVIPDGLFIDHLCEVKSCINPDHLEPVTRSENALRWNRNHPQTECRKGHAFDEANTLIDSSSGARYCRTCKNDYQRRRWHNRKND